MPDEVPVCLGLGTNLGDRLAALRAAVGYLRATEGLTVITCSPVYETQPAGGPAGQPDYLNAVVRATTHLSPTDLLGRCLAIERLLGRRRTVRYGPRTLDMDVLLYEDLTLNTPELVVPHPRLAERAFVLIPLADVAGEWVHPVFDLTVGELLGKLSDGASHGLVRRVWAENWAE